MDRSVLTAGQHRYCLCLDNLLPQDTVFFDAAPATQILVDMLSQQAYIAGIRDAYQVPDPDWPTVRVDPIKASCRLVRAT